MGSQTGGRARSATRGIRKRSNAARATHVSAGDIDARVRSAADALGELSDLEEDMRALEVRKIRLIGAAQKHGATWDQIGSALDVTRQAAWEKYRDPVREVLDATAARAEHSEAEALASAAAVLKEVRARRRR